MGKTSIDILEESIAVASAATDGGEIATVLGGAVRGKAGKVYTLTSVTDLTRIFGVSTSNQYKYIQYLLNRGNVLRVVRVAEDGEALVKATANTDIHTSAKVSTSVGTLTVTAVGNGTAFNGLKVTFINQGGEGEDNIFSVDISDASGNQLEVFTASINPESAYYFGKTVKSDIIVMSMTTTTGYDVKDATLFQAASGSTKAVNRVVLTLAGGTDGTEPAYLKATLAPLENCEVSFATLILPERIPEKVTTDTQDLFKARTDFELVLDPGVSTPEIAISALTAIKHSNICAYFPKLQLSSFGDYVPSCVCIADLIASLHRSKLWYKAPAGLENGWLTDVIDVAYELSTKEIADLQEANINPIIVKTGTGVVVWGNSTRAASILDIRDLAVRLLTNYFKRSVYRVSQRFIFADHNEFTWGQWKNEVEPIIRDVAKVGGIRAYKVVCDRTTMSQEDINNGIMRGTITFWPISHIEKIVIKFGIDQTGVTFE